VSGCVETVPPAAACKRSVGPRAARPAKARGGAASRRPTGVRDGRPLEEPVVGLSSRRASAGGATAPEGLAAKRARREMAPQRLEKVQFAPGDGMAPPDLDPQYLVQSPWSVAPKNYRRRSPNGRGDERRACLGGAAAVAKVAEFGAFAPTDIRNPPLSLTHARPAFPPLASKVARSGAQDVEIARAPIDVARQTRRRNVIASR
jgi:hypothetical protein